MTDNSRKMTLEERIVQTLKEDTLMRLVGDEDALTDLVKRAITEALFAERTVPDGYSTKRLPSPVVQAAQAHADKIAQETGEQLMADEKTKAAIRNAMIDFLPNAIQRHWDRTLKNHVHSVAMEAVEQIRNMKAAGMPI